MSKNAVVVKQWKAGMIVKGAMDNRHLENVEGQICSRVEGLECMGNFVDRKGRFSGYFVRYEGKLYESHSWNGCGTAVPHEMEVCIVFEEYDGNENDIEAISNYKYILDYYKPDEDKKYSEVWYYKESELDLAKARQKELGEQYAFLKEI